MDQPPLPPWRGTFQILPPSSSLCRNLSGDKVILPPSGLDQLLHPPFLSSLPSSSTASFGSWSVVSHPEAPAISKSPAGPLMFRLSNTKNNNQVFAGIREFSAPEGTIGLSPFLFEALNLRAEDCVPIDSVDVQSPVKINITAAQPPKGTYVRLRPLEAGYNPDNWKPLLERQLRENFTCLTLNSVLSVRGSIGEEFKLLIDQFAPEGPGICVIDTDLVTDIEPLNEEQARETQQRIAANARQASANGSSPGGVLELGNKVAGRILPGHYVDYHLDSWPRDSDLTVDVVGEGDNSLDIFLTPKTRYARAKPREDNHVFGNFFPARSGHKSLTVLADKDEMDGAESILISVHACQDGVSEDQPASPLGYIITVYEGRASIPVGEKPDEVSERDEATDSEQCEHCHSWVPKQSITLHRAFCARNNVFCPNCNQVFKRDSPEWDAHWHCPHDRFYGSSAASKSKHDRVYHWHRACPACNEYSTCSLVELAFHRTNDCPGKIILCRFCHLEVPQEGSLSKPCPEARMSGLTPHEFADGSRTTDCYVCDKIVQLRNMEAHMRYHELDRNSQPTPKICRNVLCGRTLYGVGPKGRIGTAETKIKDPGNEIGLCAACFAPLYVSSYDPDGKALARRIERRYLRQLATGCQKEHCKNMSCRTGRAKAGQPDLGTSLSTLMPVVRKMLPEALDPGKSAIFCVDEDSAWGRVCADDLAKQGWNLGWCVAAAEASKDTRFPMQDWLEAWAPRRQR